MLWYSFLFSRVSDSSCFISWDCLSWFYFVFRGSYPLIVASFQLRKLASSHPLMANCHSIAGLASYPLDSVLPTGVLGSTGVFLSFPLSQCPRDILWSFNYFEYNCTRGLNLFGESFVSVCMRYGHENLLEKMCFHIRLFGCQFLINYNERLVYCLIELEDPN